ncbi:MAG: hypothetical protein ABW360_18955, partial [Phenylobacterium sp.]
MRDFASRGGLTLLKTPNARQQSTRRRLMVICGVLALALVSGVIGSVTTQPRGELPGTAETSPFSYFP